MKLEYYEKVHGGGAGGLFNIDKPRICQYRKSFGKRRIDK
jgi:hypothetical protein